MKTLIKIDRNGTKYWYDDKCLRCGGQGGRSEWGYTGYTCYECGGTGHSRPRTWKEYTPEYEAKLEARRELKSAKAAGFETVEEWKADLLRKEEEARIERERKEAEKKAAEEAEAERIKAQKAISQFIGDVGAKIIVAVTFCHSAYFDMHGLFGSTERVYIHNFRDENGNALVWKTQKSLPFNDGDEVIVTGTIKAHDVYKDEKQTVLTRCKVEGRKAE